MSSQELFTDEQKKILKSFVSNTDKNIFVLYHLPEVIKGALFSRYSRSALGLRSLLLKEFINNEQSNFFSSSNQDSNHDLHSVKKAQDFYDRILDGFGDDSIGELGGAHLALENISMLAAKMVEDCRIGGSPLEKSTRYIYFNQKVNGEYLFYREKTLMNSSFKELYLQTCNHLFDVYSALIPPLTKKLDLENGQNTTPAYTAALRAKVLDCLRGLLPASTLTNMGVFGNGRFYEGMLKKMFTHPLQEMQDIGNEAYDELNLLIPSFIRRSHRDHKNQQDFSSYTQKTKEALQSLTDQYAKPSLSNDNEDAYVKLVEHDKDSIYKVAATLLYEYTDWTLEELTQRMKQLSLSELEAIFEKACSNRQNRRHKSPRALERAEFTFEMVSDFGIYRDLQRHRMLTQERQLLNCSLGYYIPQEIVGTEMEAPYKQAMDEARAAFEIIAEKYPREAQYIVPMAYRLRWYFHVNLRSLQWLCELRSSKAGHPNYRRVAQQLVQEVFKVIPPFRKFFAFMDFEMSELGRMDQEIKRVQKQASLAAK